MHGGQRPEVGRWERGHLFHRYYLYQNPFVRFVSCGVINRLLICSRRFSGFPSGGQLKRNMRLRIKFGGLQDP
jgi:hypothetical protein